MNPATATTSLNQVPALHKFVAELGMSVFDFGAGKKGKIDAFYQNRPRPHVYVAYDPFNRTREENVRAWRYLEDYGTDIVTCANVLNVLSDGDLAQACWDLRSATKHTTKETVFVSVYHNRSLPPMVQRNGYVQRNQPITEYIPFLKMEFSTVAKAGNFLMCKI